MELPAVKEDLDESSGHIGESNYVGLLFDKEDNNVEDETMLQSNAEIYDRFGDLFLF